MTMITDSELKQECETVMNELKLSAINLKSIELTVSDIKSSILRARELDHK